jgi:hypothetical protein
VSCSGSDTRITWLYGDRDAGDINDDTLAVELSDGRTLAATPAKLSFILPEGLDIIAMDETQAESGESNQTDKRSEAESGFHPVSGFEINLGDFSRTQGLVKSLRLTLNNQVAVPVDDVASGVGEAGRKFKMGDVEQANYDVGRLYSTFHQKTTQWESQARNLEQQMRMKAAKNPKSVSIDTMNRMKSEQIAVRTRIRSAEVQFRRLHQGLEQAFTTFKNQSAAAESTTAVTLPSGFLAPFKAAPVPDRPQIVKDWFEIESVIEVDLRRSTQGYKIRFAPKPPLGRIYYLTMTAQVILLRQLDQVVAFEDLETGQEAKMKLKEFVKHVQSGAWLLKLAPKRPGAG